MKTIKLYIPLLAALFGLLISCSKEEAAGGREPGAELKMGVSFGQQTRLAELPTVDSMSWNANGHGLYNVGLYLYYTSDYARGDLSKPYIRNRECKVVNGELLIVQADGANPADERIFIYDDMTLVAFYPYNPNVGNFTTRADEEAYPITRDDYAQQYYIPYRAQTTTDPTRAYTTRLVFYPKHTYKIEITVVSETDGNLPTGGIRLLPGNDPVGNAVAGDGKREAWLDRINVMPNGGGGSNVNQYIGYLWTREGNTNDIKRGDILLQSGNLTLIASQDVYVSEQNIYRYGYNMTTGEIFIPTASTIIHDLPSLAALNNSAGSVYQACPIDLGGNANWTPVNLYGGRYDGGGHAITGLQITSTAGNTVPDVAGLFGQVQGNTTVANVNLVDPVITVSNPTADQPYYVGALAGRLNAPMSEEARQALIANVPPNISPIVKEALIEEILANASNSTANIVASRVTDPAITVTGKLPYVGTVTGLAGAKDNTGEYKSRIWDTASTGGTVSVNAAAPEDNAGGYIGGFAGLNNGSVDRSFTTVTGIVPATDAAQNPSTGFATQGSAFGTADGYIRDSYSTQGNLTAGVQQMPGAWPSGWASYSGIWPINPIPWLSGPENSFWYTDGAAPATYPTLQWQRR